MMTENPPTAGETDSSGIRSANVLAVLGRQALAQGIGLIRSVLIIPLVNPAELGLYRYIQVLVSYVSFFHGGGLSALNYRFGPESAAGNESVCRRLQFVALVATSIGSILGAIFLFILLHIELPGQHVGFAISVCVLGGLHLASAYVTSSYRVRRQFTVQARNEAVAALASLAATFVGAWGWGIWGLIIGSLFAAPVNLLLGCHWISSTDWIRAEFHFIRFEVKNGAHLLLSTILNQLCLTSDVLILKHVLSNAPDLFGFYSFGATAAMVVWGFMAAIAEVQAQEVVRAFRAEGCPQNRASVLRACVVRDSFIALILSAALMIALGVVVPLRIPRFLPALAIIGPFLVACIILRWRTYPVLVLNTTRRHKLVSFAAGLGVLVTGVHIAIVRLLFGNSVFGYSLCSATSYFSVVAVLYRPTLIDVLGSSDSAAFMRRFVLAHLAAPALLLPSAVPASYAPVTCIGAGVIVAVLSIFAFWRYFPDLKADMSLAVLRNAYSNPRNLLQR